MIRIIFLAMFLSFVYSQCDGYSQTQCGGDDNCEWIENLEIENCYDILDCTGGCTWQDCESIEGCNWHFGTAYYDPSYCYGEHEVDNSYCEEIQMPDCSEMSFLQCSSDDGCGWVEDVETGNCDNYNSSASCNNAHEDCWWDLCYGGYYGQWSHCCRGGSFQVDNSYCEEIEILECSDMIESECSNSDGCDWVEDIDNMSCSAFSNENCVNQEGCFLDQDCNQWGSWYSWICYDYGPVYCSGNYQIDNSYCEEVSTEYQMGDINEDYSVNILDVIIVVNLILDEEDNPIVDMNNDHSIDILDIIQLINIILTP